MCKSDIFPQESGCSPRVDIRSGWQGGCLLWFDFLGNIARTPGCGGPLLLTFDAPHHELSYFYKCVLFFPSVPFSVLLHKPVQHSLLCQTPTDIQLNFSRQSYNSPTSTVLSRPSPKTMYARPVQFAGQRLASEQGPGLPINAGKHWTHEQVRRSAQHLRLCHPEQKGLTRSDAFFLTISSPFYPVRHARRN